MNADHIAQTLASRLAEEGMKIDNVESARDVIGNIQITITAPTPPGVKSVTLRVKEPEVANSLLEDFDLVGPTDGFVDHEEYRPQGNQQLVVSQDSEM